MHRERGHGAPQSQAMRSGFQSIDLHREGICWLKKSGYTKPLWRTGTTCPSTVMNRVLQVLYKCRGPKKFPLREQQHRKKNMSSASGVHCMLQVGWGTVKTPLGSFRPHKPQPWSPAVVVKGSSWRISGCTPVSSRATPLSSHHHSFDLHSLQISSILQIFNIVCSPVPRAHTNEPDICSDAAVRTCWAFP